MTVLKSPGFPYKHLYSKQFTTMRAADAMDVVTATYAGSLSSEYVPRYVIGVRSVNKTVHHTRVVFVSLRSPGEVYQKILKSLRIFCK